MNENQMRRIKRKTTFEEAEQFLYDGEYGVFSTVGSDGYPYGVPVNYVYDSGKIYFHCAKDVGHKEKNLEFSNKVSFTVVKQAEVIAETRTTFYESAIAFGTARKNSADKIKVLEMLVKKYSSDFYELGLDEINKIADVTDIIEITVEKLDGKANRGKDL